MAWKRPLSRAASRRGGQVRLILFLEVLMLSWQAGLVHSQGSQMSPMERGVNRPGLDYSSFEQPVDDPAVCSNACARDQKCRAWTYVRPNIQGPHPRCWLKSGIPSPQSDGCCVSGTKRSETSRQARMSPMEMDRNRPGGDYNSFNLAAADPRLCQDRCQVDPQCQAWTYVKPGVQGQWARCWLKNAAPPSRPDTCCVSGTKVSVPAGRGAAPSTQGR